MAELMKTTKHLWANPMRTKTMCESGGMLPEAWKDTVADTSDLNPKTDALCTQCKSAALTMVKR
jgi:hypothetical protein